MFSKIMPAALTNITILLKSIFHHTINRQAELVEIKFFISQILLETHTKS
jgi:hypothetical protein